MPHHTPLIGTIVAGLVGAFLLGALAQRMRLSPLVGYLLAGVVVGPFTPGYVADQSVATELAEIGVILLMFGVGLHFSLGELLSVRKIAVPGALVQIAVATLMGAGLGALLGWPLLGGLIFGLALSVASTVVLLRALQERHILRTEQGRIAVGWLVVEDLAMVVALVLLPALAGAASSGAASPAAWLTALGLTLAKVAGFVVFMLLVGRKAIPWVLHYAARTGSRELFRLAVFSLSLGVAFGAATLFGVSFALGAFFAGMILAESELSQRAAEEALPLRDAFAVLFFVSVGMLFNPRILLEQPLTLLATLAIVLVGKSVGAFAIIKLFRRSTETGLTIAASLAQIGEFSFILAALGVELGVLPTVGRDMVLASAIISIMANPFVFGLVDSMVRRRPAQQAIAPAPANDLFPTSLSEHIVLIGFGRVGETVAEGLEAAGWPFLIIEADPGRCEGARQKGYEVLAGNAIDVRVLGAARVAEARRLLVAIPGGFEAGEVVRQARALNPALDIAARAHSDQEVAHLARLGADETVMGEREIANALLEHVRRRSRAGAQAEDAEVRPLLTDAEHALLTALRSLDAAAGQPMAVERLFERAAADGFTPVQLAEALKGLKAKDCLVEAPYGEVAPTARGVFLATQAR